jgi:formate dehydrogenase iron-sulfur subunit
METIDRRKFLKGAAITGGAITGGLMLPQQAFASKGHVDSKIFTKNYAVLFDATKCIGCRNCEKACNETNKLEKPEMPFDDIRALEKKRRTDRTSHTVINRFYPFERDARMREKPVFVKYQCMHCNVPACVSACIVEALRKEPDGPVSYEEAACIGCRYCMIACPFQIPVYEFDKPLLPVVHKCTLCQHRIPDKMPACVESCPQEAMIFGRREDILALGHEIVNRSPELYEKEIYGEKTAGGTSWLYLLPAPYEKLGLPTHSDIPEPQLSETIQHGVFSYYFAAPLLLYIILGAMLFRSHRMESKKTEKKEGDE